MGIVERVFKIVQNLPYESSDYVAGRFDCTNMSMVTHKALRNKGIDNWICIGESLNREGHVWVEVKNTNVEIETTTKRIFKGKYNALEFNIGRRRFDSAEKFATWAKLGSTTETNRKIIMELKKNE